MHKLRSHLELDSQKRSGILILILLIVLGYGYYFLADFSTELDYDEQEQEVIYFQAKIDSLKALDAKEKVVQIFPFNPNFITDFKGYTLGMSPEEIDRLLRFRESGKWVNSAADFQAVTKVSDSLLAAISPYFKFPEWVTNPVRRKSNSFYKPIAFENKADLNSITRDDLTKIEGMTEDLAIRILNYRKKIGGFLEDNQLYDVYGLERSLVYKIRDAATVKVKPEIKLIDVNKANASDLATIPYISFDVARDIIDYRILHEGIRDLEELLKIEGITPYKFDRIKLYLSINHK